MRTVLALMNRNRKLFFKDKGMLFTSMITPVILIVLYATFLAKVFRDSFTAAIPDVITISDKLINGTVAAQLTASLMAVSCITVPLISLSEIVIISGIAAVKESLKAFARNVAYRTIRITGVIIAVNNIPLSLKNNFLFLFINANTVLINAHLPAFSL